VVYTIYFTKHAAIEKNSKETNNSHPINEYANIHYFSRAFFNVFNLIVIKNFYKLTIIENVKTSAVPFQYSI
jgi:hypothetical protein